MADQFFLSLWLKDYSDDNMMDRFRVLLEAFPYSKAKPRVRSLYVYPLEWSEHPVLEEEFPEGEEPAEAIALASEFLHADYAYEASVLWDLWLFRKNGGPASWKETARPVTLICYGPNFEEGRAERGHLEVGFGLDTPFRADQQVPDEESRAMARDYREKLQANIRKLLEYVRVVNERLPVARKTLWTESGENFAEMIRQSFK